MKSIVNKKRLTTEEKINLITNKHNLSFDLILELVYSESNHNEDVDISASNMYDTVRQTIFGFRYPELRFAKDVLDTLTLASSQGNYRHAWIERAWKDEATVRLALKLDNINPDMYTAMVFNPEGEVPKGKIPVYIEHPLPIHNINGIIVGGTPDLIFNGMVKDYKTTSPFSLTYKDSIERYRMQMSSYRWQAPHIITKDTGTLNMRYPAWNFYESQKIPSYPEYPMETYPLELIPYDVMNGYIDKKTKSIIANLDVSDSALPPCPEDKLGINKKYKTYSSIDNYNEGKRAGRTFDDKDEALNHTRTMKSGALVEFTESPSLCKFCSFTSVCNQFLLINKTNEEVLKVW